MTINVATHCGALLRHRALYISHVPQKETHNEWLICEKSLIIGLCCVIELYTSDISPKRALHIGHFPQKSSTYQMSPPKEIYISDISPRGKGWYSYASDTGSFRKFACIRVIPVSAYTGSFRKFSLKGWYRYHSDKAEFADRACIRGIPVSAFSPGGNNWYIELFWGRYKAL